MDAIWRNILEGFWGWKGYEVYPEEQLRAAAEENGERETVAVCRRVCTLVKLKTSLFEGLVLKRCHNFSYTIDTVRKDQHSVEFIPEM